MPARSSSTEVLESLTVEENLKIGAYTRRDADGIRQDMQTIYEYFPRPVERRHQLAGYLSGGEQQMLVIGCALMAKPRLLLLDEPSLGLAPLLMREIFEIIQKINAERGTTFLLVEQNAQIALGIAHYGYIMEWPDRLRRSGPRAPRQRRRPRVLPRPPRGRPAQERPRHQVFDFRRGRLSGSGR